MGRFLLIVFLTFSCLFCNNQGSDFQRTDGKEKGDGSSNTKPVVTAISHNESNWDGSGNPLPTSVSCTVEDADGLDTIQSVRIEQTHTEPGNYIHEYQMADDGNGDDTTAGDGIYTKTFVQNLAVNALWYTNLAGHQWECTAEDDFLDKGVLTQITN